MRGKDSSGSRRRSQRRRSTSVNTEGAKPRPPTCEFSKLPPADPKGGFMPEPRQSCRKQKDVQQYAVSVDGHPEQEVWLCRQHQIEVLSDPDVTCAIFAPDGNRVEAGVNAPVPPGPSRALEGG